MSSLNLPWCTEAFPVTGHKRQELSTALSISSPQEAAQSNEVPPQFPSLQTGQAQSPQLLLTGHSFQPLISFVALLEAFKDFRISLKLRGPELQSAQEKVTQILNTEVKSPLFLFFSGWLCCVWCTSEFSYRPPQTTKASGNDGEKFCCNPCSLLQYSGMNSIWLLTDATITISASANEKITIPAAAVHGGLSSPSLSLLWKTEVKRPSIMLQDSLKIYLRFTT